MSNYILPNNNNFYKNSISTIRNSQSEVKSPSSSKIITIQKNSEENEINILNTSQFINLKKTIYEINISDTSSKSTIEKSKPIYDPFQYSPKNENEIIVSIYINGDMSSTNTYNILSKEFFELISTNKRLTCLGIYIYDKANESQFNYSHTYETVISNFTTLLLTTPFKSNFLVDSSKITETGLEESLFLAQGNKSSIICFGYNSLKGAFGINKQQQNNIDILLTKASIPFILFKEFNLRKDNKTRGYNWFILFDHSYINCFKSLLAFSNLIDKENDYVYGYGAYPSYITFDVYKKKFLEYCQEQGFHNYSYESEGYVKKTSQIVIEKVNYGSTRFDYLVMYNNVDRHIRDVQSNMSESFIIINKISANICVYNNLCDLVMN